VLLFVIWAVVSAVAAFLTLGTHVLLFCSVFSDIVLFCVSKINWWCDDDGVVWRRGSSQLSSGYGMDRVHFDVRIDVWLAVVGRLEGVMYPNGGWLSAGLPVPRRHRLRPICWLRGQLRGADGVLLPAQRNSLPATEHHHGRLQRVVCIIDGDCFT